MEQNESVHATVGGLPSPEDATACCDQEPKRAKLVERYGLEEWCYLMSTCHATLTKHGHL